MSTRVLEPSIPQRSTNIGLVVLNSVPIEERPESYKELKELVKNVIEGMVKEGDEVRISQVITKLKESNPKLKDIIIVEGTPTSPTLCKILLELEKEGLVLYSSGTFYRTKNNIFPK